MKKSNRQHKKSGASLALVAVCAGVIIIFLIACFQIALILGGTQELNYTADAAALNIAKRAMEIRTAPTPLYSDCADSSGLIGLANINRVWGKAYLINANVEEFIANQKSTDLATTAADQAFTFAQAINDDLYTRLNNHPTLLSFFNQVANLRFLPMFGNSQASSSTKSDWSTASVYRGDTSNLSFSLDQIVKSAAAHCNGISTDGKTFLQGYTAMEANSKPFYFVAFHPVEMPHLVSESFFNQNRLDENGIASISNPLPNAFSAYGTATNSIASHAFAIANPQRQYNLSIPHAFISVSLQNIAHWIVQDKQVNITTYGVTPETQWGAKNIPLGNNSYLDGYASLGNESSRSLWDALQSIKGDNSKVISNMVQRLQEIKLDFNQSNLVQLLQQQPVLPDVNTYLIYPSYTSPDNTDPHIQITPISATTMKTLPKWLNPLAVNEAQKRVYLEQEPSDDSLNYNWQMVHGSGYSQGKSWVSEGGELAWQPGTGANQTLGQISIIHITYCYFTAQPTGN